MGDLSEWFFPVVGVLVVVVVMVAAVARVTETASELVATLLVSAVVLFAVGKAVGALLEY